MASINFYNYTAPSTLLTGNNYSKLPQPVVLRTDMEAGPPKQRAFASMTYVQHSVTYLFSNTDYNGFLNWLYTTAAMGSIPFNWTDPTDNVTKDARIVKGQITAAQPTSPKMDYWTVQFIIEVSGTNASL